MVKSEGELTMVRPDRLRWELKPPDAVTILDHARGARLRDAEWRGEREQERRRTLRRGAQRPDDAARRGLSKLRARYELTVRRAGSVTIVARPLAEDVKKHLKSLTLVIAADLWTVQRIEIEENGGDSSVITFGKMTRDAPVDPAKMQPPKR